MRYILSIRTYKAWTYFLLRTESIPERKGTPENIPGKEEKRGKGKEKRKEKGSARFPFPEGNEAA